MISIKDILILIVVLGLTVDLYGDTWRNPEITDYYSENGLYMLRVFPTEIPENYSKWKVAKTKKKEKFSAQDSTIIKCHAILFKTSDSDTTIIWKKKLINQISPVVAIVANDGNSIVTFDNWHSNGYGMDVMVAYDKTGGLIKRFKLEDFSPIPINEFEMSISSLWWRCGVKYIDNNTVEICFKHEDGSIKSSRYYVDENRFIYEPFPPPRPHTHPRIFDEDGNEIIIPGHSEQK